MAPRLPEHCSLLRASKFFDTSWPNNSSWSAPEVGCHGGQGLDKVAAHPGAAVRAPATWVGPGRDVFEQHLERRGEAVESVPDLVSHNPKKKKHGTRQNQTEPDRFGVVSAKAQQTHKTSRMQTGCIELHAFGHVGQHTALTPCHAPPTIAAWSSARGKVRACAARREATKSHPGTPLRRAFGECW